MTIDTKIPYKIYLSEDEMPKAWYNVRADMNVKPAPLLNPGTGKPMDLARLSTVIRTALIRGGLEQLSLGDLSRLSRRGSQRQTVLARLSAVGSLTREEVMDLLGVSKSAALKLLKKSVVDKRTATIFLIVMAGSLFLHISPVWFVVVSAVAGILLKSLEGRAAK